MSPTALLVPSLHRSHDPAYLTTLTSGNTLKPKQIISVALLSAIITLLLAALIYCVARMVCHHRCRLSTPGRSDETIHSRKSATVDLKTQGRNGARRTISTQWPRKDSDVLWSMYITDDELAKQFHWSRRPSRLFSIGSVGNESEIQVGNGRRRSTFGMEKDPLDKSSFESRRLPDCPTLENGFGKPKHEKQHQGPLTATTG